MTAPPSFRRERFRTAASAMDLANSLVPILAVSEVGPDSFPVEFDARATGGALLLRLTGGSMRLSRPPLAERDGGWDHQLVLILREGAAELSCQDRTIAMSPGDHILLDMTRNFALTALAPFEVVLVLQPRGMPAVSPPHGVHRPAADAAATMMVRHIDYLLREAVLLDARAARAALDAFSLLARGSGPARAASPSAPPSDRIDHVRRFLAEQATTPRNSPDDVAQALGLSRASLYRVAGAEGGVSAMLMDARLRLAVSLLLSQETAASRIADLSRLAGFASSSLFSRRFAQRYGIPPLSFRSRLEASGEARIDPRFAIWLVEQADRKR